MKRKAALLIILISVMIGLSLLRFGSLWQNVKGNPLRQGYTKVAIGMSKVEVEQLLGAAPAEWRVTPSGRIAGTWYENDVCVTILLDDEGKVSDSALIADSDFVEASSGTSK